LNQINRTIKAIIESRVGGIHTALPAKIESYNAKTMYATVILLNKKKLEESEIEIPPIVEVPVAHFNASKFIIRPPYAKGDIVQVVFNERALDKLLITGKSEEVKLTRKFSYDDAVVVKGLKIEQEDDLPDEELDSLYIANLEHNNKIIMRKNGDIRIVNEAIDNPAIYSEIIIKEETDDIEINRINSGIDVGIKIQSDGIMTINDNTNGAELKFDFTNENGKGAGSIIFTLAEKLLLNSGNTEGVPKGHSLETWLNNHIHPGDSGGNTGIPTSSSPPPSEKVFVE